MKKLLLLLLLFHTTSYAQDNYHIKLSIEGAKGHTFYLMPINGGIKNRNNIAPVDSMTAQSDTFSFRGVFTKYMYYSLVKDSSLSHCPFIIDTDTISVICDIDSFPNVKLHSYQNDILSSFGKKINPLIRTMNNIQNEGDETKSDSIQILFKDTLVYFARQYPYSFGIFSIAGSFMDIDIEFGKRIFPLFSESLRLSGKGRQMEYMLYQYDTSKIIGATFPVMKTYDTNHRPTTFKPDKHKIYLIDYWASWCVPCIEKLPELKILAAKYKNKNFEIISLSIDKSYETWIKAIQKHKIPWGNYSGLNGTETEDAKYFNITSIPYTILVGLDNKIIKLNPTEEEVEEYLKQNLN